MKETRFGIITVPKGSSKDGTVDGVFIASEVELDNGDSLFALESFFCWQDFRKWSKKLTKQGCAREGLDNIADFIDAAFPNFPQKTPRGFKSQYWVNDEAIRLWESLATRLSSIKTDGQKVEVIYKTDVWDEPDGLSWALPGWASADEFPWSPDLANHGKIRMFCWGHDVFESDGYGTKEKIEDLFDALLFIDSTIN